MIFELITSTEFVAWYGALIASIVLLWDIYKWKTQGPKLVMRLSPNMQVIGDPAREGKSWILATVSNVGGQPTTIKSIGMLYFATYTRRLLNRVDKSAVFPDPSSKCPLPIRLEPGDEWQGFILQDREDNNIDFEALSQTGHLMIYIVRSGKQREIRKRLVIA